MTILIGCVGAQRIMIIRSYYFPHFSFKAHPAHESHADLPLPDNNLYMRSPTKTTHRIIIIPIITVCMSIYKKSFPI